MLPCNMGLYNIHSTILRQSIRAGCKVYSKLSDTAYYSSSAGTSRAPLFFVLCLIVTALCIPRTLFIVRAL